jgi:ABC-type Fe3+-siderophore transport system permease subunit
LSDNDRRIARRRIGIRGSIAILAASAAILTLLALLIGRYPEPGFTAPGLLADDSLAMRILLRLRLPRIFAALLLGLNLGLSGAVFQMLLRNPLVEPGFLGVSQGAALGAALAILFFPAWASTYCRLSSPPGACCSPSPWPGPFGLADGSSAW